jgi:hypothetical protein
VIQDSDGGGSQHNLEIKREKDSPPRHTPENDSRRIPNLCFSCDYDAIVRHVVRWVSNLARCKPGREQFLCQAVLVHGGSILPPGSRKR